jgi:BioD-like phosphotransacetylase family protein
MTRTLLVSSTEESTGKTAIALALAQLAREKGLSVGYMKPKGTRLESHVGKTLDRDPMLARELLDLDAEVHDLEPVVYSPTFVREALRGHEEPNVLRERIQESFEALATDCDLMVVEGGGELTTGAVVELADADVADLLDAAVLLVTEYDEPGGVDDVLAAAATLGDRLVGVLFNAVESADFDQLETEVVPFLESRDMPVVGVLPRERDLAGVTVEDLRVELDAEVLTDAPTDAFVERFIVGAMGGDAALGYFRRTKDAAVVTGGDRSDVLAAALEAPGVKCLVLTGGLRPTGAVLGTAEAKGVPVLLVQADTLTTIDRADEVVRSGRTRDERTVERMRELLYEHANV